jgi:hypothetical protein
MTMTIEDELTLIRRNRSPVPARDAPAAAPAPPPLDPAAPEPVAQEPAKPDPRAGLPPQERGVAPGPSNADFSDVMGAGWRKTTIETDAWNYTRRKRNALATEMFDLLSPEARARMDMKNRDLNSQWQSFEDQVLAQVAIERAATPVGKFDNLPLDRAQFDSRIDAERRAEWEDAVAVTGQRGGGVAEFLGSSGRYMTDQTSLALLPFGLYGSAFRVIASSAVLGAVAEAAVLPREFRVAEELGLQDPDAAGRILGGAVAGGAIGGAILGLQRLVRSLRAGINDSRPPGADPLDHEIRIDEAEANLRGDPTVREATAPRLPPLARADGLSYNEAATLDAIIGVESGGRANAQNPASSARGLGQFISTTWMDMIRRHRPDLMEGRTPNEVLALRDDGQINAEMTRLYARENHDMLRAKGLPAGPGEIYLAHFMGPGGAVRALSAPLDTPIAQLMTPKEIAANKGIRFGNKSFADFTAADLRGWSQRKMRRAYDPNASTDMPDYSGYTTSRGYTGTGQVSAGDEFRIDVQYEVVDVSSLTRASGRFQPRDRSRITSDAWIADTAARLDPALLLPSPDASHGPPIVGQNGMIESGNGRVAAIERAYAQAPDRATAYRTAIEAAGYAVPQGVERPVLIARRTSAMTDDDLQRFTVAAQDSGVARMSSTDMARAQSQAMTAPVVARLDPTQPLTADANGGFVRAVLAALSRSERNALFDDKGLLNREGQRQLREALFARAWPDPTILTRYTETDAGDLKSLMDALERAAPSWVALRADIEAGRVVPEMDISGHVIDAMLLIGNARALSSREGLSIGKALDEMLDEVDLLAGPVAPLTVALVRKFWRNGRVASADDVAGFLTRYADDARRAGASGALFDAPGPRDVLRAIDNKTFADLPEDLGTPRSTQTPAPPAAMLAEDGFDQGAASPEAMAADAEIRADIEGRAAPVTAAEPMFDAGAVLARLAEENPDYRAAIAAQQAIAPTTMLDGYGTDAFWQQRKYRDAEGGDLLGRDAAVTYLVKRALALGWSDEGLSPGTIRAERKAKILIGPPAAGKSVISNPLARARGAAIVDADEAKKVIPEYGRGEGAAAVHEESAELSNFALDRLIDEGTNLLLPKLGGSPASIERLVARLKEDGYEVDLFEIVTAPGVVIDRMIGRGVATGRFIPPGVMADGIDGAPRTYQILKAKGIADGYARIDNNAALGQPRGILEGGPEVSADVAGGNGSDRGSYIGSDVRTPEGAEGSRQGLTPRADPGAPDKPTPDTPPTTPDAPLTRRNPVAQGVRDATTAAIGTVNPDAAARRVAADLDAEFGSLPIEMPDGTSRTAREVLQDLDDDAGFDAFIQSCAIFGGAT